MGNIIDRGEYQLIGGPESLMTRGQKINLIKDYVKSKRVPTPSHQCDADYCDCFRAIDGSVRIVEYYDYCGSIRIHNVDKDLYVWRCCGSHAIRHPVPYCGK